MNHFHCFSGGCSKNVQNLKKEPSDRLNGVKVPFRIPQIFVPFYQKRRIMFRSERPFTISVMPATITTEFTIAPG